MARKSEQIELVEPYWERQPKETEKAYSAFVVYRDLPPVDRNVLRAVRAYYGEDYPHLRKRYNVWRFWAQKYRWRERVSAWEEYKARVAAEEQIRAIREMNERHVQVALAMLTKAAERLSTLSPDEFTASEVRAWLSESMRLERLIRGEHERHSKVDVDEIVIDIEWGNRED